MKDLKGNKVPRRNPLINERSYIIVETVLFDQTILHEDEEHSVMITLDLPESDECIILDELNS